jgi:DNA modification methylase
MSNPTPIHREEHGARIVCADSLDYLKTLPDNSVDSIVTDPPYEIGFMGRGWDNTGIAYTVELWKECLRVLKPGGHALVFGATRTYHRITCALEDAGFEIRDSIHWMYGSGFPKSLNIGKAIEAQVVTGSSSPKGQRKAAMGADYKPTPLAGTPGYGVEGNFSNMETGNPGLDISTAEAKQWSGLGTALKPAHEPIVVARKPVVGTVANNVLQYGTGGLNIDGSRVGRAAGDVSTGGFGNGAIGIGETGQDADGARNVEWKQSTEGRFPANILLTHNADCEVIGETTDTFGGGADNTESRGLFGNAGQPPAQTTTTTTTLYACTLGCPVAALDEQSGESKDGTAVNRNRNKEAKNVFFGSMGSPDYDLGYGGSGGASRFFTNLDHDEPLTEVPFHYSGKAPKKERPVDPTTGKGHPTVKPLSVMRWLINLVTPPGGTVLEPFAGSGATVEAALLDGFKVIAIDITPEHMPLIDARIDRWSRGESPVAKPKVIKKPVKASNSPVDARTAADQALAALQYSKPATSRTAPTLFDDETEGQNT